MELNCSMYKRHKQFIILMSSVKRQVYNYVSAVSSVRFFNGDLEFVITSASVCTYVLCKIK